MNQYVVVVTQLSSGAVWTYGPFRSLVQAGEFIVRPPKEAAGFNREGAKTYVRVLVGVKVTVPEPSMTFRVLPVGSER